MCVTVQIEDQWSSPGQPPHNETETGPLKHSEHPLRTQSGEHECLKQTKNESSQEITCELLPSSGDKTQSLPSEQTAV